MRRKYTYFEQRDFRGGINEEPENALRNQVLDARNVWCPQGRIEQRPGFRCEAVMGEQALLGSSADSWVYDTSITTLSNTLVLDSMQLDDVWYAEITGQTSAGENPLTDQTNGMLGLGISMSSDNTNNASGKVDIWDGTKWVYVPSVWLVIGSKVQTQNEYVFNDNVELRIGIPDTWVDQSSGVPIGDTTKSGLWLRVKIFDAALDASTEIDSFYITGHSFGSVSNVYARPARFGSAKRAIKIVSRQTYISVFTVLSPYIDDGVESAKITMNATGESIAIAVVPETDEAFISIDHNIVRVTPNVAATIATAEDDLSLVGDNQSFGKDTIAQLGDFPRANYLMYFYGQLWAAGIEGEPFTVRWSAPLPGHKVWPAVSFEPVVGNDNSPISGLSALHEHVVVFKRDSIWRMVYNGQDSFGGTGLNLYTPVKDVSGIGCVRNESIALIPDGLVFLNERGVYLYNGTPSVHKISDSIDKTMSKIKNYGLVRAAHWREKMCYLLAVCVGGGGTNNLVLVYDYKHKQQDETGQWVGSWWIWNMNVVDWLSWENSADEEELYFIDKYNRVNRLDAGDGTDLGNATSSYFVTHRLGTEDSSSKRARDLRVNATSDTGSLTVEVVPDDNDFSSGYPVSLTDPLDVAPDSVEFGTAGQIAERQRRESRVAVRETGQWFKVKVSNSTSNQRMKINKVSLGAVGLGVRS